MSMAGGREVGYALIGPGYIGEEHLRRLRALPGVRIAAVVGRGGVEAALADAAVDVVLIATPHTTHAELAMRALAAGKHVLLEKPVSHRLSEARAITETWRQARAAYPNLGYGVMFQERMQPIWRTLRGLLAERVLGRLIRVTWIDTAWYRTMAYYGTGAWRATWAGEGGGALINQAVHRLDLYGWLFGRPTRVRAIGALSKHHAIETEDEATLLFEHADGMIGHFITSTAEFPGTQRLEIVGEHGRLVWEDGRLVRERTSTSVLRFIHENTERFGVPTSVREDVTLEAPLTDPHAALLAEFTAAVRGEGAVPVAGEDGEASVELVNAAILAMHRDAAVALPLEAAEYDAWLAARIATEGGVS
ncbi:MAG: Gfo/Idh/MocA family oxidoreductase [Burkholderiales bacterium]|nr:Gfo/Idh/MocA family oxidoreductase [Opitutaceae bacterium]